MFTHNDAELYGGAIYFGEQHEDTLVVRNSVLDFNTAYRAGGECNCYIYLCIYFSRGCLRRNMY